MDLLILLRDQLQHLREQAQDSSLRAIIQFETSQKQIFKIINTITTLFMWSYTLVTALYMDHPVVWKIGFFCSLVHSFSYFILKKSGSLVLASYLLVLTGGVFQTSFAFFNGGFHSATLIWVAILPLIVGVLTNIFHTLVWFVLSLSAVVLMYFLTKLYAPVNYLNPSGVDIIQFMIAGGIIILVSGFTVLFLRSSAIYRRHLLEKNMQIQGLLRTMSHDLATPMTVLKMGLDKTQNVLDSSVSVALPDSLPVTMDRMKRSLRSLEEIIGHVKKVAVIDSGKLIFDISDVRLLPVVQDCIDMHSESLQRKDLHVSVDILETLTVKGNSAILQNHIFNNLLSNAIKFSKPGSTIELSAAFEDEVVHIRVRDYGVGIEPERLRYLFHAGKSYSTLGTANETGTGFGMLLVKAYLEAMGGSIQVQSKEVGTEVVLLLRG